ncbi:MAG: histidine kinase dimerization/phospho-acceptor domain-containing protein, partial [Bacteroidales bacterium]
DQMALGAYEAASALKKEHKITFIGIDALAGKGNGIELVRDGILNATFIYPTNGDKVIQTAMQILRKKEFVRETILHTAVVEASNAHIMHLQNLHIAELDGKIGQLKDKIDVYLSRYGTQKFILYGSLFILLLVLGLLVVVIRSLKIKNHLNVELSVQKQQLEAQRDQLITLSRQLEDATHAKLMFFTNISHDFRTPLTLVADPVEQLMKDKNLTFEQNELLSMIRKNVHILLRLVNQ